MTTQERIDVAKRNLDAAKQARTVAETQLKEAVKRSDEIVEKMKDYGVTPETIEVEITRLQSEIESGLSEVENAIPTV